MPASLPEAEELARQNNPRVQEAIADLNTSREEIKAAQSELGPRFNPEARPATATTSTASRAAPAT